MPNLKRYRVDLGGKEVIVQAANKLDAEGKAVRSALNAGEDQDWLLSLSDDDVKVTRA